MSSMSRVIGAAWSAPAEAKCLTAWRLCVTGWFLTAHNLLIDGDVSRVPDGHSSCNFELQF